ncbi:IS982 family transposase [Streptomyces sp. NPDC001450]
MATALYVRTDDLLKAAPQIAPWRPKIGIAPQLSDAELVTLAVMQVLLGFTSEARWLRHARAHLRHLFPNLPQQSGWNKRLRRSADLVRRVMRELATDTAPWHDDVWVVDSTLIECGRSRGTARRSDLAGWAEHGYCASHARYFWGPAPAPGLHSHGLPVAFALTDAKAPEREVLLDILTIEPALIAERPGRTFLADKNYYGREFEQQLADLGAQLLRAARKDEPERAGSPLFKPLRQPIESVNQTLKAQLDLERHGGRTPGTVTVRILRRFLALTAAVWRNAQTDQPVLRSLTAFDH